MLKSFPAVSGIVLDNACGIGAAAQELLKVYLFAEISAADVVPPMMQSFKAIIIADSALTAHVKDLRLENDETLTYANNSFNAILTNFDIFFFQNPVASAKQIYRTLKPSDIAMMTL